MQNKRVLVLGGSYFIGKKIVETLLTSGYQVTTLNRGTIKNSQVDTIICDRDDSDAMKAALSDKDFDIVIDVSGLTELQVQISSDAIKKDCLNKYIYISSSSIYAVHKCIPPYRVGDTMGENEYWQEYGLQKGKAELYLYKYFEDYTANVVVLRPPYVYGEGNYAQRESFMFNHILNDKPILIPAGGDTKIQFIYVSDLANIVKFFCDKEVTKTYTINVGNKEAVTFNKWIALCAEAVGKKATTLHIDYKRHNYGVRDFFPFHNYINVLSTNLIEEIYHGEQTPMAQGLKNAYEWYLQNADTIQFKPHITDNETRILKEIGAPLN